MSSSLGNIPRKCLEKLKTLWYSPIVGQKNGLFKLSRFSFSGTADCQVIDRLAAKINTIQGLVKVCKKNFFAKIFLQQPAGLYLYECLKRIITLRCGQSPALLLLPEIPELDLRLPT